MKEVVSDEQMKAFEERMEKRREAEVAAEAKKAEELRQFYEKRRDLWTSIANSRSATTC